MRTARMVCTCIALIIAFMIVPGGTAMAQDDVAAAARANRARKETAESRSDWYTPTRVVLHQQEAGESMTTTYEFGANDDLRISMDGTEKGKHETAMIMLIHGQGQWMLTKGAPLERGYEIDALDGPVLELKLVMELLRTAAPAGPAHIKEKTAFNVHEEHRSISINTMSAEGGLEAPWAIRGSIDIVAPDQLSFEMTLIQEQSVHFTGTWQKEAAHADFSDDISLDGWKVYSIGPIKSTDGNSTILDYGAKSSKTHPRTLGELRKASAD